MQKIFLATLLCGLVISMAGCATGTWNPNKEQSEWANDHAECEEKVRAGIRANPVTYNTVDEMKLIRSCMEKKGWQRK